MTSLIEDNLATVFADDSANPNSNNIGALSILALQVHPCMFNIPKIDHQIQLLSQFSKRKNSQSILHTQPSEILHNKSNESNVMNNVTNITDASDQQYSVYKTVDNSNTQIFKDYFILKTIFESEASVIYLCVSNTFKQKNTMMSSHLRSVFKDNYYVIKLCYGSYLNPLEYKIMLLHHSSLMPCLDVIFQKQNVGIVMPTFHTTLTYVNLKAFDVQVKIKLLLVIAEGLQFLHEQGIYHGDIKPDNIFINYQQSFTNDKCTNKYEDKQTSIISNCALGDFGLSSYVNSSNYIPKNSFPFVTPFELYNQEYLSKDGVDLLVVCYQKQNVVLDQYLDEQQKYLVESGIHSDIWAFGMLCFYMLFNNRTIFDFDINIDDQQLTGSYVHIHRLKRYMHFLKNPELFQSLYLNQLNVQWYNIISSCLQLVPQNRASLCHIIDALKQMYINLSLNV